MYEGSFYQFQLKTRSRPKIPLPYYILVLINRVRELVVPKSFDQDATKKIGRSKLITAWSNPAL